MVNKAEISFKDWIDDASARPNGKVTYMYSLSFNGTEINGSQVISEGVISSQRPDFDINPLLDKYRNEIVLFKLERAFSSNQLPDVTEEEIGRYVYERRSDLDTIPEKENNGR